MSLRSPLSRVLGKGSAKEGTEHWWMQRLTAVALVFLGVWFLVAMTGLESFTYDAMLRWVADPFSAVMLVLLSLTLAWHSSLGVQVVIEDYVHGAALKLISLVLNKFVHVVLGVVAVIAVLKTIMSAAP